MISKNKFLILLLITFLYSCGIYRFNGASISPEIKTISIATFSNNAPLGPSNMSVTFTEGIKDYYQKNTSLALVDENGDLQIDGYIENYTIAPVGANAGAGRDGVDISELTRITITVYATYTNTQDNTFDFEKRFSFFKDVNQSEDLTSIEQDVAKEVFDQIIIDIFNASVANW